MYFQMFLFADEPMYQFLHLKAYYAGIFTLKTLQP
uniref:Uncharacterized protein n=1 Tax=Anguilla anguilla TaxID=7936 RepID=A0A0E9UNV6_ANGAN